MKVTFNTQIANIYLNKNYQTKARFNSNSDVFIKTTSFKSNSNDNSFDAFKAWAKESNFLVKADDIIQDENNYLGNDDEGAVYSIPNCDKWVIKKHKQNNGLIMPMIKTPEYTEIEDVSPNLNIGQPIAVLMVPTNTRITDRYYIHKAQNGGQLGVSKSYNKSVNAYTSKKHIESLSMIEKLPQESIDDVVRDTIKISNLGRSIDGKTPTNFILDSKTGKIGINNTSNNNPEMKSQCAETLYALLGGDFASNFEKSHRPVEEKMKATELSNKICAKFFLAMKKEKAKFALTPSLKQLILSSPFTTITGKTDPINKVKELREAELI